MRPRQAARSRWARRDADADRGTVTAELAIALPGVVLLLVAVLALAAASTAQMRSVDGARAGARSAAIGESDDVVVEVVRTVAGADAEVSIDRSPPWVTVTVRRGVGGGWLTTLPLEATAGAVAWIEP